MSVIDDRQIALLKAIKQLALVFYPYQDSEPADPRLTIALGQIAGIATMAMDRHERDSEGV